MRKWWKTSFWSKESMKFNSGMFWDAAFYAVVRNP